MPAEQQPNIGALTFRRLYETCVKLGGAAARLGSRRRRGRVYPGFLGRPVAFSNARSQWLTYSLARRGCIEAGIGSSAVGLLLAARTMMGMTALRAVVSGLARAALHTFNQSYKRGGGRAGMVSQRLFLRLRCDEP